MSDKPSILALIPARAGSKGLPGKNTRLLAGKPLIGYTFESALAAMEIETIVLSTDCAEAITYAKAYPEIEIPFVRPQELSLDNTSTIDVVKHALDFYASKNQAFDYVCILQPTSPFRRKGLIDEAIRKMITTKADSLTTVRKIPAQYNPHWTFKMNCDFLELSTGEKNIITRRQELPEVWHRDGQIYITTIEQIKKGTLLGGKIIGFKNESRHYVNIDTKEDWELAEQILINGSDF